MPNERPVEQPVVRPVPERYEMDMDTATAVRILARDYMRTVAELQELARQAPYVTHDWVLQVASMAPDDMRRRLIRSSDWRGHLAHCLDGIPEIRNIGGGGIDGCRSHKEVRAIVLDLLRQIEHLKTHNVAIEPRR